MKKEELTKQSSLSLSAKEKELSTLKSVCLPLIGRGVSGIEFPFCS